jgi:hypothetical protein
VVVGFNLPEKGCRFPIKLKVTGFPVTKKSEEEGYWSSLAVAVRSDGKERERSPAGVNPVVGTCGGGEGYFADDGSSIERGGNVFCFHKWNSRRWVSKWELQVSTSHRNVGVYGKVRKQVIVMMGLQIMITWVIGFS